MAKKTVLTCDRCDSEKFGIQTVYVKASFGVSDITMREEPDLCPVCKRRVAIDAARFFQYQGGRAQMIWNIILCSLIALLFWSAITYWASLMVYPETEE